MPTWLFALVLALVLYPHRRSGAVFIAGGRMEKLERSVS